MRDFSDFSAVEFLRANSGVKVFGVLLLGIILLGVACSPLVLGTVFEEALSEEYVVIEGPVDVDASDQVLYEELSEASQESFRKHQYEIQVRDDGVQVIQSSSGQFAGVTRFQLDGDVYDVSFEKSTSFYDTILIGGSLGVLSGLSGVSGATLTLLGGFEFFTGVSALIQSRLGVMPKDLLVVSLVVLSVIAVICGVLYYPFDSGLKVTEVSESEVSESMIVDYEELSEERQSSFSEAVGSRSVLQKSSALERGQYIRSDGEIYLVEETWTIISVMLNLEVAIIGSIVLYVFVSQGGSRVKDGYIWS